MLQMLFRLNDCPNQEYVVDFRQTFSTIYASEYVRSSFFIVAHIYILVQYLWALFWTFKSQAAQAVQANMIEGQSPFRGVLDQVRHLHLQIVFSKCRFLFENSFNALYYINIGSFCNLDVSMWTFLCCTAPNPPLRSDLSSSTKLRWIWGWK